jgi:aminoglycoside phosphotransferase (APT) family kinase protein
VGDPLADLGLALAYWTEPQEAGQLPPAPTDTPGFPSRREVAARYLERSGRPEGDLTFYVALAHWKVACMAEGVYTRHWSGDMGTSGADMDLLRRQPGMRAEAARRVLDGGL